MANSIDQFNYYDPLVKKDSQKMSEEWISQMSSFIDVLVDYLQPYGMMIPQVTTAQMNSIQSPVEGQMIYNIDATPGPPRTAQILIWQVKAGTGAWRVVTTV
jgi:hypothetical protein